MKVYTFLVFFTLLAYTNSISKQNIQNTGNDKERTVNLALETVLEFNNKDSSADIHFLDNVQKFISKVKTVLGKSKNSRRDFNAVSDVEQFSDFIQEFIAVLNTFDDTDFIDIFDTLIEELKKYHYRGCKFYELTENHEIRNDLVTKLEFLRQQPANVIKAYINSLGSYLREDNHEDYVDELLVYIDSLYRDDAREKFKKVLNDFEHLSKSKGKRTTPDTVKVIRDSVRSIVFDHYTNLNRNARKELKSKIEKYWKKYDETVRADHTINNGTHVKKNKTVNNPENIKEENLKKNATERIEKNEDKTTDNDEVTKSIYRMNGEIMKARTTKGDIQRIEIKQSDYKMAPNMRDGVHGVKPKDTKQKKSQVILHHSQKNTGYEDVKDIDDAPKIPKKEETFKPKPIKKTEDKLLRTFTTEEEITGEIFEQNSIEFEQEKQAQIENSQPKYITLYTESIIVQPKLRKKPENVIHRSKKMTTLPKMATLWVEESTGGIPGSQREHTSRSPQNSKSVQKSHKRNKSKDNSKNKSNKGKKDKNSRQEQSDVRTKKKKEKKGSVLRENSANVEESTTDIDKHGYKKMMHVPQFETTVETQTPKVRKKKKSGVTAKHYEKQNLLVQPSKVKRTFRKSVTLNPKNLPEEKFYYDKRRGSLRKNNKNDTTETGVLDENVMNRLKDLETELRSVKIRMKNKTQHISHNDTNLDEATKKNESSHEEIKLTTGRFSVKTDKTTTYKADTTVTKYDENKELDTEWKDNYVARANTNEKEDDDNENVSEVKERKHDTNIEIRNNKFSDEKDSKEKEETKAKFIEADKFSGIKVHDFMDNNLYDDNNDIWKDTYKSRNKFTNTKPTTTSTLKTTQTTKTTEETTVKTTENTISTHVEIFIPISMPPERMTSYKPVNQIRINEREKLALDNLSVHDSPRIKPAVRPKFNVSSFTNNDAIRKEVMYMFKKNDITIPNEFDVPPHKDIVTDNYVESTPDSSRSIPPDLLSENGTIPNDVLSDPFNEDPGTYFLNKF